MKKIIKILIITALVLNLSGCWNRRELNTLGIVLGVGIDATENDEEIEVTAQLVDTSDMDSKSGSGGGSGESAFINLNDTGTDIMSIFRCFTHKISRKLYIAHNQIIVFGKDMAKKGIHDSIDFFMRDHESRLTVNVLVANEEAADIFEASPEFTKIPSSDIAQLIETQGATSETPTLTLIDLMSCLTSKTCSAVAPIIELFDDEGEQIAAICGSAVFKEDKMVGELDRKESRGYLWVMNKIESGIMRIDIKNENVNLEIIKATSEYAPEIKDDGTIEVTIKINESGSIASFTGSEDMGTEENIKLIKQAAKDYIKDEIEKAISKSQELNADIFQIGESIHRKYPDEWKTMEDNWDELYKNITFKYEIEVTITGMGRLAKAAYPAEGS